MRRRPCSAVRGRRVVTHYTAVHIFTPFTDSEAEMRGALRALEHFDESSGEETHMLVRRHVNRRGPRRKPGPSVYTRKRLPPSRLHVSSLIIHNIILSLRVLSEMPSMP